MRVSIPYTWNQEMIDKALGVHSETDMELTEMSSFNDHQQAMGDAAELLVEKELEHYKQSLEVIKVLAEVRAKKDPSHQDYADLVYAALDRGVEISQEELDWEYVSERYNWYQTGNSSYDEEYESEYDKKLKAEKKKEEEIEECYRLHLVGGGG